MCAYCYCLLLLLAAARNGSCTPPPARLVEPHCCKQQLSDRNHDQILGPNNWGSRQGQAGAAPYDMCLGRAVDKRQHGICNWVGLGGPIISARVRLIVQGYGRLHPKTCVGVGRHTAPSKNVRRGVKLWGFRLCYCMHPCRWLLSQTCFWLHLVQQYVKDGPSS